MTPRNTSYKVDIRLSADEYSRLNKACTTRKTSRAQLTRDAIRWYLKTSEPRSETKSELDNTNAELGRFTNRICALLAKLGIDLSTLCWYVWDTLDDEGKELYRRSYAKAVKRTRERVNRNEGDVAQSLAQGTEEAT